MKIDKLQSIVFSKYLIASAVALVVDVGLFLQLIVAGFIPAIASAISYSAGIVVHWAISSRFVFKGRVIANKRGRAVQQAQFAISALAGLTITTAVVAFGSYMSVDPRLSKGAAMALSFLIVWYARNRFIFRASLSHDA